MYTVEQAQEQIKFMRQIAIRIAKAQVRIIEKQPRKLIELDLNSASVLLLDRLTEMQLIIQNLQLPQGQDVNKVG